MSKFTELKAFGKKITIEENAIDRFAKYWSPTWYKDRMQSRIRTTMVGAYLGGSGGYTGAKKSKRSMINWRTTNNDADSDINPDLPTLRNSSRDLIRNNPLAAGAINTVCTSTIGPGLKYNSTIDHEFLGLSAKDADKFQNDAERLFENWACSREADMQRSMNFYQSQDLAIRSPLENGDAFVLLPYLERAGSQYGLKFQFIEADRVCNRDHQADSKRLSGGIVLDGIGAPEKIQILKTHPGGASGHEQEWQDIRIFGRKTGRRNVLHLIERKRIGQNRGVPYLAPVIESFKQIGDYTEAEIMAALVSSMFTVFVQTESGTPEFDFSTNEDGSGGSDDGSYAMGNASVVGLGMDEKVEFANPTRPNANFDPFIMAILRQAGAALEIPFELLIKHFSSSFSASKASLMEAWRTFKKRRTLLVYDYCQPIIEAFLAEQVAVGRLTAPGFFDDPLIKAAYCGSEWVGRPMGALRPLEEANAAKVRIDTGTTSIKQEKLEHDGGNADRTHMQRVKENDRRVEDKLIEPISTIMSNGNDTSDDNK